LNYAAVSKKGGFRNVPCYYPQAEQELEGQAEGTGRHEWNAGQVTWLHQQSLDISISLMPSRSLRGRLRGHVDRLGGLLDRSPGCKNPPLDTTFPQAEKEC